MDEDFGKMDHQLDMGLRPFETQVSEELDRKPHFRTLFKDNWVSVLTDCIVFGSFGMGVAILGPTLFDLGCQTSSNLKELNWVFFVQLLMTLVGSISVGCLVERFVPIHVMLLIGMIGLPVTMFLVPACSAFAGLLIDLMLMGWCMGCIDCVANLRMILRFGTNVAPFLQAMHFCYGLGAFISPMIAAPFMLNVDCSSDVDITTPSSPDSTSIPSNVSKTAAKVAISRAQHLSHLERAFFILGSIQFLFTAIVFVVIILEKKRVISTGVSVSQASSFHSVQSITSDQDLKDISGQTPCFYCGSREIIIITLIASASLFLYDGLQSSYADYIYSYAMKNVRGLKKVEGAFLNACFWGTFALGRLIAIPCATRFTAAFMLTCNLSGCLVALVVTLIFRGNHVVTYLGTCVLGLFLSSMSPTIMSLTELFIDINASVASCLVVCAALGETLCPVIVGNLFVVAGPPSFLSFCTIVTFLASVLYAAFYYLGKDTNKYRGLRSKSFIWITEFRHKRTESNPIKPLSVKYYTEKDDNMQESTVNTELPDTNSMPYNGEIYR